MMRVRLVRKEKLALANDNIRTLIDMYIDELSKSYDDKCICDGDWQKRSDRCPQYSHCVPCKEAFFANYKDGLDDKFCVKG